MYTLYGSQGCGSAVIEVALERCKLPYKVIQTYSAKSKSALAKLGRVNPLKQVPTLVWPDGTVMSESAAILIQLGLANPEARLLPIEETQRARSLRGLVFIAANCYVAVSVYDSPARWCADCDDASKERVQKAARERLHLHFEMFADLFDTSPYLEGETPGALDFLAAVVSKWLGTRAHLKKTRPKFFKTLQRIDIHPDVAPIFARHWNA